MHKSDVRTYVKERAISTACIVFFFFTSDTIILRSSFIQYLGVGLDSKFNWRERAEAKRKQVVLRFEDTYRLLGKSSKLSSEKKIFNYEPVIKFIRIHGIETWRCASPFDIVPQQRS